MRGSRPADRRGEGQRHEHEHGRRRLCLRGERPHLPLQLPPLAHRVDRRRRWRGRAIRPTRTRWPARRPPGRPPRPVLGAHWSSASWRGAPARTRLHARRAPAPSPRHRRPPPRTPGAAMHRARPPSAAAGARSAHRCLPPAAPSPAPAPRPGEHRRPPSAARPPGRRPVRRPVRGRTRPRSATSTPDAARGHPRGDRHGTGGRGRRPAVRGGARTGARPPPPGRRRGGRPPAPARPPARRGAAVRIALEVGDQVHGRAELGPHRCVRQPDAGHQHQRLQPPHGVGRAVGVDGGERAVVPGVHRLSRSSASAPRTSPTIRRSGRIRSALRTRSRMVTAAAPSARPDGSRAGRRAARRGGARPHPRR